MIKLWRIGIALLLVFALAACSSDDDDDVSMPITVAGAISGEDDLSTLLNTASDDQLNLLMDETASLTVFAPTNEQFTAASDLLATLSPAQVTAVIGYHVVAARYEAADLIPLDGQTIPATDISVSVRDGSVFLQGSGNSDPIEVIEADITADNGVLHKIGGILLPAEVPGITTYEVMLEGAQEVPPVETDAMGSATVTYNEDTGEMTLAGSVSNLSSPLFDVSTVGPAHIHEAPRGENGGVAFPIDVDRSEDGLSATLSLTATLTDEQASTLQSGGYYINIHTENFNGGELRGQIE
jgi:uncharacterized surface protein with fasciclin (FAS1) repeats